MAILAAGGEAAGGSLERLVRNVSTPGLRGAAAAGSRVDGVAR
jgi:hypothetical protein